MSNHADIFNLSQTYAEQMATIRAEDIDTFRTVSDDKFFWAEVGAGGQRAATAFLTRISENASLIHSARS